MHVTRFMLLLFIVLFPSTLAMAQQENSLERNASHTLKKKFLHSTKASPHYLFAFSKTLPFIGGLIVSYKFVEVAVDFLLMDYLVYLLENENEGRDENKKWRDKDIQRIAALVTNLQDGLSSLIFVIVSQITEEYTGCFNMITYCAPVSILGLVLLWVSTSSSACGLVYPAIILLTFGTGGQMLSETFLKYQLQEHIGPIWIEMCLFFPSVVVYIITVYISFEHNWSYNGRFRFAAFLMLGTYVLFLIGSLWYSPDELPIESNLGKIYRTCKAALWKWKLKYPATENGYYWKGYMQKHLYKHGEGLRLLPRVPRLFRRLDKAAIVKADEVSLETQEKNGKLCTVKGVREVKSLVPMIYLGFTFFGYSFLLASGNTFFVAQASNSDSVITDIPGNDIYILILIMDVTDKMSRFIYFLVLRCLKKLRVIGSMPNRKEATIIRVGLGMFCALICCLIAWKVEIHRLSSKKNTTLVLVPQFILLGMAQGLVHGGFMNLFYGHVAESMRSFADSFSELVIGTGKLLIIPLDLVFNSWFDENVDTNYLDKFFLMLAIFNAAFLVVFAYYSIKYAYKEECPKDEKFTLEQTLEDMCQLDPQDSYLQGNDNDPQLVDQVMVEGFTLVGADGLDAPTTQTRTLRSRSINSSAERYGVWPTTPRKRNSLKNLDDII